MELCSTWVIKSGHREDGDVEILGYVDTDFAADKIIKDQLIRKYKDYVKVFNNSSFKDIFEDYYINKEQYLITTSQGMNKREKPLNTQEWLNSRNERNRDTDWNYEKVNPFRLEDQDD